MNIIKEEWKSIDGYEGIYEVSSLGRVKSLGNDKSRKDKILKPAKDRGGYLFVRLCRNGKPNMFLVHRLVATAFIPNPFGLPEVNHLDENKANNVVSNIEWTSRRYNINFGTRNERSAAALSKPVEASRFSDFREICLTFASAQEAGRNGYDQSNISACCNLRYNREGNNKYRGLFWRFAS